MQFNRFFFILVLWFPFAAAAGECYFTVGYGTGEYRRDYTEKFEDRILGSDYIEGSYVTNRRSHPYQIGGGCDLGRYAAVEVDYFQGLRTEVTTTFAPCVDVLSAHVCSPPILMRRVATLEGWELSLLGKLPVSERWSITGRLGVLSGVARINVTVPEASDKISLSGEKRGNAPIVGLGLRYRPTTDFSLAFEHKRFDGKSRVNQIVGRWYF